MLLALTSAARTPETNLLDLKFLVKHSTEYIFQFGENTKTSEKDKPRNPIKLYPFSENKKFGVCHHFDLYIQRTKKYHKKESR